MADPRTETVTRTFNGGELSPDLYGRVNLDKYRTGAALMQNWVPTPQGAMHARSGMRHVSPAHIPGNAESSTLIPFVFNDDQAFVLEFSNFFIRFYTDGAIVIDPNTSQPLLVNTPYTFAEAKQLRFVQSNDVVTLVHPNHPPKLLARLANDNWTLNDEVYAPVLQPPASLAAAKTEPNAGNPITHQFKVTAFDPVTGRESLPTAPTSVSIDLTLQGNYVTLSVGAPAGGYVGGGWLKAGTTPANHYKFYKEEAGVFGYIGETDGTLASIAVHNIAPDLSKTPPRYDGQFDSAGHYPSVVGYWQQRKVWAATENEPQTVFMSETATESSLNYHHPGQATDSIEYTLAARQASQIRHVVGMRDLFLFTAGALWRSEAVDGVVAPDSLKFTSIAPMGSADARPIEARQTVLYATRRGNHVMELNPNTSDDDPFILRDLSILSAHLFRGRTIIDTGYINLPNPVALFLRDDGVLLGLTYLPEEQVTGWFQIVTDGEIGSIAVVPEGIGDSVYMTVNRFGQWQIEQLMLEPLDESPADADRWHLDSCMTYEGASTTTITGLSPLLNQFVFVVDGDGNEQGPFEVSPIGEITLDTAVTKAFVGLKYPAVMRTLPLVVDELKDAGMGAKLSLVEVAMQLRNTVGVEVLTDSSISNYGPGDPDNEDFNSQWSERETGTVLFSVSDEFDLQTDMRVIQRRPQPAQVLAMSMRVSVGDGY